MIPLAVLGVLLIPVAHDMVRRPNLRRIALRNTTRRRGEAVVVVVGAMLGTAIIVASLIVGRTMSETIRDEARTELGPIDLSIIADQPAQLDAIAAAVDSPLPDTDGRLPMVSVRAVAATTTEPRRGDPVAWVGEVDFGQAAAFGADAEITGFADARETPGTGEALVNGRFASELGVESGDTIEVYAYGQAFEFVVTRIVPTRGVAGFNEIFVTPGAVSGAWQVQSNGEFPPPRAEFLVSATGGIFDTVELSPSIAAALEESVVDIEGAQVFEFKRGLLEDAEAEGAELTELFAGIGSFAILAGVLLLVNLFVMLAEERRSELGLMRAVGMKRNHLVRGFALEGALYAVAAGVLGAAVGLALGWLLVLLVGRVFEGDGAALRFSFDAGLLAGGAALGISISLITAWATSLRLARVNIVRALRDLPEPTRQVGPVALVVGVAGVIVGTGIGYLGWAESNPPALLGGPGFAIFCSLPAASRAIGARGARLVAATLALIWGIGVFAFFGDIMNTSEIGTFVVQGVVLVAGAVLLASGFDGVWSRVGDRWRGRNSIAARLGLAYPLAHRNRTGLVLGMFSLVVFTLTFLTVFTSVFDRQTDQWVADASAGFDVIVDSSRVNPVEVETLRTFSGVTAATELDRGWTQFRLLDDDEPSWSVITGFDESFLSLGGVVLSERDGEYSTDADALRAVLKNQTLAVVSDSFLESFDGPGGARLGLGERVTIINPGTEETRVVQIVGVTGGDFFFNGLYVHPAVADSMMSDFTTPRHYVQVDEDAADVAARLNGAFIEHGVEARSFVAAVSDEVGETISFVRVLQGFLALGLVVGIGGLGVMLVRAVQERRRHVGVMRAIGFESGTIRRWFQLEAAFVATQGVVIGVVLGLATAYQVLVNAAVFGDTQFTFSVSSLGLALVIVVPLVAALAAAVVPSNQAAAIAPAAALRATD